MTNKKDLIIYSEEYLGDDNVHGAPEVQRIVGEYKGSEFVLDRIYEGAYEEDGETYYNSFNWDFEEAPFDEDSDEVDIDEVVELYKYDDYQFVKRT